jgi:hypothetical protein
VKTKASIALLHFLLLRPCGQTLVWPDLKVIDGALAGSLFRLFMILGFCIPLAPMLFPLYIID